MTNWFDECPMHMFRSCLTSNVYFLADELGDLFDEITFTQDRSIKSRMLEYFVTNPLVTAGMSIVGLNILYTPSNTFTET